MHHPTDRIAHTMAFVTPVVEHWLEIAQLVHNEGLINNPSHHEQKLFTTELHLAAFFKRCHKNNKKIIIIPPLWGSPSFQK